MGRAVLSVADSAASGGTGDSAAVQPVEQTHCPVRHVLLEPVAVGIFVPGVHAGFCLVPVCDTGRKDHGSADQNLADHQHQPVGAGGVPVRPGAGAASAAGGGEAPSGKQGQSVSGDQPHFLYPGNLLPVFLLSGGKDPFCQIYSASIAGVFVSRGKTNRAVCDFVLPAAGISGEKAGTIEKAGGDGGNLRDGCLPDLSE